MSIARLGSYWDEDPDYPSYDWRNEVADESTRLGYWDWVDECKERAWEETQDE